MMVMKLVLAGSTVLCTNGRNERSNSRAQKIARLNENRRFIRSSRLSRIDFLPVTDEEVRELQHVLLIL
eukprot:scaffold1184_cov132-Cylindrotheca_fusiformis.AAC.66